MVLSRTAIVVTGGSVLQTNGSGIGQRHCLVGKPAPSAPTPQRASRLVEKFTTIVQRATRALTWEADWRPIWVTRTRPIKRNCVTIRTSAGAATIGRTLTS